jgi:hypothetical protein
MDARKLSSSPVLEKLTVTAITAVFPEKKVLLIQPIAESSSPELNLRPRGWQRSSPSLNFRIISAGRVIALNSAVRVWRSKVG